MGQRYRSWHEREQIIRAIVAEDNPRPLSEFQLTESERIFFKARSARAVAATARQTSSFKSYYSLRTANPFRNVLAGSGLIGALAIAVAYASYLAADDPKTIIPVLSACISVTVVALGWSIAGWIGHRNTVRQNTNNLIFARFSHASFGENLHRFNFKLGHDQHPRVSLEKVLRMRASDDEEDRKLAASIAFVLNYYELIAAGAVNGDLDKNIIQDNIKGMIIHYYDKCEPLIQSLNKNNPKTFEFLIKLRTHYREP